MSEIISSMYVRTYVLYAYRLVFHCVHCDLPIVIGSVNQKEQCLY